MKAGIIAAGEGSRFVAAGIRTPKPLIPVGGVPLIERTARILVQNGVEEIALIVNERIPQVVEAVEQIGLGVPIRARVKTTASSMHSLYELASMLRDGPFVLCTVDSVLKDNEASGFINYFRDNPSIGLLQSYTDFVDDEKPLRIAVDDDQRVTAMGEAAEASPFVTVGLYGMHPKVFPLLEETVQKGMKRLRNFLGFVVDSGADVRGYRLSKAVDVDRPEDLEVAEAFLRDCQREATSCN